MKLCGIYTIENKINGHCYIGQSINIKTRWSRHRSLLGQQKHHSKHLQSAWNLYGNDAFMLKTILLCEPSELTYYEQALVDRRKPEYNICLECVNSSKGTILSEERRQQISISLKGRIKSPETRKKLSERVYSDEARKHISEGHKGKYQTAETRKKISEANKGRILSNETRKRLSERVVSPETRKKLSDACKRRAMSPENRQKLSDGFKRYVITDDIRKKLSDATKGKHLSDEHRKKLSESHKGKHFSAEAIQKRETTKRQDRELRISNYAFFQENA